MSKINLNELINLEIQWKVGGRRQGLAAELTIGLDGGEEVGAGIEKDRCRNQEREEEG